jgi:hypothetical protein
MCDYYEYSVTYKGCKKDPKHLIRKERDYPCDKAKEGGPMCSPVNWIL